MLDGMGGMDRCYEKVAVPKTRKKCQTEFKVCMIIHHDTDRTLGQRGRFGRKKDELSSVTPASEIYHMVRILMWELKPALQTFTYSIFEPTLRLYLSDKKRREEEGEERKGRCLDFV